MVSTENSADGNAALCRRLHVLLDIFRPLIGQDQYVSSPVPDIRPEYIAALTDRILPLYNKAWQSGGAINIWDVAGLKYNEGRNSAVLAWFLDPQGSHGWGERVLREVLRLVCKRYQNWPDLDDSLGKVSVVTECWPVGSTTERVDIVVDGDDFTLFVEIKINAREGKEQLARYMNVAEMKRRVTGKRHGLVLYLSPAAPLKLPEGAGFITWKDIEQIFLCLPKNGFNGAITQQFAQHIQKFY